ncbi:hypothetical protein [Pseudomonas sp. MWU12-2037]|uniref:hypothetical protein n=1 Tax=Pseudomonas sp. MWU12-2037 TaxID=2928690 RepID=UPI00200CE029|nr:hypothetical protein [Pseudomonas sp. MWU12-2037]
MNGLFNELLRVDVVTDSTAGRSVLFGRKAVMLFLLIIAVCFVGGLTTQARAQTVHDQGTGLTDAVSSPGGGDYSALDDSEGIISIPQVGYGSFVAFDETSKPASPSPVCSSSSALNRIKNKLSSC